MYKMHVRILAIKSYRPGFGRCDVDHDAMVVDRNRTRFEFNEKYSHASHHAGWNDILFDVVFPFQIKKYLKCL